MKIILYITIYIMCININIFTQNYGKENNFELSIRLIIIRKYLLNQSNTPVDVSIIIIWYHTKINYCKLHKLRRLKYSNCSRNWKLQKAIMPQYNYLNKSISRKKIFWDRCHFMLIIAGTLSKERFMLLYFQYNLLCIDVLLYSWL